MNKSLRYYSYTYHLYTFLYRLIITMRFPIVTLYIQSIGYTLVEIGFGYSILAISAILMDLPCGYLSDKYGKQFAYAFGIALEVISSVLFIFGDNHICLFLAFAFWGGGTASSAGILQAWYVNIYNKIKPSFNLSGIFRTNQIILNIASFIGIVTGAAIAQFGSYHKVFIVIATSLALYAMFSINTLRKSSAINGTSNDKPNLQTIIEMLKNKDIASLLFFSSILGFVYGGYAVIWPPIFKTIINNNSDGSIFYGSVIYAMLYLLSGILLIFTNKILHHFDKSLNFQMIILRLFFAFSFILMGVFEGNIIAFSIMTLIMFVVGYMEYPPIHEAYNKFISDSHRTIGLSLSSTCDAIFNSIGSIIISLLFYHYKTEITLYFISAICFISIIPIFGINKRK